MLEQVGTLNPKLSLEPNTEKVTPP